MNSRHRFLQTLCYGQPDHPPLFEEGIRASVLKIWKSQGLGNTPLSEISHYDHREELEPNVYPRPRLSRWPKDIAGLKVLQKRLDADDPKRLPSDWTARLAEWRTCDYPLILCVHDGFFLSMGVDGWKRFSETIFLLKDDPKFVQAVMTLQGEFAAQLADNILQQLKVDAALFTEPTGSNHGPLISPSVYESLVLSSYRPLLAVLKRHGVPAIIIRTYANARVLLPSMLKAGFNCLWACERNSEAMDFLQLRAEFGRDLRLIGGIDEDILRLDKEAIRREIEEKVVPLLSNGGFIPLADGRVREDVPFENYHYYRRLLEETVIR